MEFNMNQIFPEQPLTVGKEYPGPIELADVLRAVFPQLSFGGTVTQRFSATEPFKDPMNEMCTKCCHTYGQHHGEHCPVGRGQFNPGLHVMGDFGPELPISMVEPCPEESDEVVTIRLLRKVCASQERTIEALRARLAVKEQLIADIDRCLPVGAVPKGST